MPHRHQEEREPADPTIVLTPDPGGSARPEPGAEMLLRLQRGQGNASASRWATLARQSAPTLARLKPDTAAGSVGGDASKSVDLPGKKGTTSELGDKGYTDAMLEILPAVAGQMFGAESTQGQLLEPVQPAFAQLDRTVRWMAVQAGRAKDDSDTRFSGMAKRAKEEQAGWNAAGEKLTAAGATEDRLCKEFNAGVPRGNRLFVSLSRLDGMMALMGISDPKAMTATVVRTLREAQPVAGALKESGTAAEKKTIPEATDSADSAAKHLTSTQKEMGIRWMGVQSNLEDQKAVDTLKEGEKDEKRKLEIDEAVKFLKDVGKTVDTSMAVMGVGITGRTEDGGMRGALEGGGRGVDDKGEWGSGGIPKGATQSAQAIGKAVGLEIPTDASGILETAGKLYYYKELERIRHHLEMLESVSGYHRQVAVQLGIAEKFTSFRKAVDDFANAQADMQKALTARLAAYTIFGQQLDETAAKSRDPAAHAEAPGRGKERFSTVMALVATAREVLVMAEGAAEGFSQLGDASPASGLRAEFETLWDVNGWSSHYREESPALGHAIKQLRRFERSIAVYREYLGPIDAAAAELLGPLTPGGDATAY
jgi:hypothetical protein